MQCGPHQTEPSSLWDQKSNVSVSGYGGADDIMEEQMGSRTSPSFRCSSVYHQLPDLSSPATPASSTVSTISELSRSPSQPISTTPPTATPVVVVNGIPHSLAEVRVMAELLIQARQNKEFPSSRHPNPDAVSIVEDWNRLRSLREARGDPALAPPEPYLQLRVEVTRQIRERDDILDESSCERRARDVVWGSALAVAREEGQLLKLVQDAVRNADSSTSMIMTATARSQDPNFEPASPSIRSQDLSEEIFSIVEDAMLDSSAVLRLNLNRMGDQIEALQAHVGSLGDLCSRRSERPRPSKSGMVESTASPEALQKFIRQAVQEFLVEDRLSITRADPGSIPWAQYSAVQRQTSFKAPSTVREARQNCERKTDSLVTRQDTGFPSFRPSRLRAQRPSRIAGYMGRLFTK
ncbi:hypothetical protein VTK73DRAFT_41 [Phialemonium thermophilum]|uniref:Uncharacterized protein n=1 Tax=Phialemonium thermophilum TaxID=223376 RepID=A0ABR3Y915_9PEZI